jgi:DNA (cytosine-5)-methyltransferase 1
MSLRHADPRTSEPAVSRARALLLARLRLHGSRAQEDPTEAGGMSDLTVGSLFSGGGGMDMGFERAGFRIAWHSEIDKDAVAVLRLHWPDVPQLGSVTDIDGGQIEPTNVVIGGFPCQDLSRAGKGAGLTGTRSGLFWDFVRIVREMREATQGRYPALAIFENVDGLLSNNGGRDFAHVLAGLQNCGAAVAFRVLDAQLHGVPQRRRRVFIVADFAPVGAGEERAAKILALSDSLCGHPAASEESGQGSAAVAENGVGVGGFPFDARNGVTLNDVASSIQAGNGDGRGWSLNCAPLIAEPVAAAKGGGNCAGPIDVAACLSTSVQRLDFESQTLIVAPVASAITASAGHHGHSSPRGDGSDNLVAECYGFHLTQDPISSRDAVPAISSGNGKGMACIGVCEHNGLRWIVRRLTPTEGERCQGWPDDWSRWRADGSEISDSARWRLIGNGVATPVSEWIARRARTALEAV